MKQAAQLISIVRHCVRAVITNNILKHAGLGIFLVLSIGVLNPANDIRTSSTSTIYAQPAETINFQARLLNANGNVVSDGNYSVEFRLYDEPSGGASQWTETHAVDVRSGYLSSYLGINTSFPSTIDWSQQQWLTMNVEGDGEMSPRIRVTAVPFALQAGFAGEAGGLVSGIELLTADDFLQTAPTTIQSINESIAGLRFNQAGSGGLVQLQGDGEDRFVVNKAGTVTISGGLRLGTTTTTTAGMLRWTGSDFEGYSGSEWISLTSGEGGLSGDFFEQGGSAFDETAVLGTTDTQGLSFITDDQERLRISSSGNVGIGTSDPSDFLLQVAGSIGPDADDQYDLGSSTNRWRSLYVGSNSLHIGEAGNEVVISYDTIAGRLEIGGELSVTKLLVDDEALALSDIEGGDGVWLQGGNAFGEPTILGTTDSQELQFVTDGVARMAIAPTGAVTINNGLTVVSGGVTADSFSGSGAGLTALNADELTAGTVNDDRLSANMARLDQAQTFTGLTTLDSGMVLGNTTTTTAGALRWNGADFEGYDGSEWVSLTSSNGGGLGMLALGMFHSYDSAGGIGINGWTDLTLDTQVRADGQFTHTAGNAVVTIEEDGWYEIAYNASYFTNGGGNNQTAVQSRVVSDTGSGFVEINGSSSFAHVSTGGGGDGTGSATILRQFQQGDQIKLQAQRASGDTITIETRAESVGLTIRHLTDAVEGGESGGGSGLEFAQGGNAFGTKAILGTTDTQGLDIITNNQVALAFSSGGLATFAQGVTIDSGGMTVTGDSTIDGTLSGLTGITVDSGGLDLSSSGITNAGNITGVGDTISSNNGLTINSGNNSNLALSSASGVLAIDASTWRRTASGTTSIQLNDSSDTALQISNTGSGTASLVVDGDITASNFSGSGSGLTSLSADNIATGTLSDNRLSGNVALLNQAQTFSGLTTFSNALVVGNTSTTQTGTIRWNGADFQGYDGTEWVSLTTGEGSSENGGGGGTGLEFVQSGNAFGAKAILGTTDEYGLDVITSGTIALAINALGDATFTGSLNVDSDFLVDGLVTASGGLFTIGSSTQAGSLELYDSNGNRAIIEAGSLSGNRTFTLPNVSGEICTSAGNCAGGSEDALLLGGNATSEAVIIGSINNQDVSIKTNDTNRLTITGNDGMLNLLTGGLQTLGTTRLTSGGALQNITGLTVISGGANISGGISIAGGATISSGGISITGASSIDGTLELSNTLTITGGGANVSGGLSNNNGGITDAGAVSGVTTLTASGNINTSGGAIQTAGVTRITNEGSLVNIDSIAVSGAISTLAGFEVNGATGISGSCSGNNNYMVDFTITGGIVTDGACRQNGDLSDARLKENVTTMDSSILDGVSLINTVNFDFRCEDPEYADMNLDCERQTGVIAQELADVFPELVYEGDDGFLRVRYDALNIYTLRAVTELAKVIDSSGTVDAKEVKTAGAVRVSQDGKLTNITGLSLVGGGASIAGGIDNNLGGMTNVGALSGVTELSTQTITIQSDTQEPALRITKEEADVFTIADNGALDIFSSDSHALGVRDQNGESVFRVDSKNGLVYIGEMSGSAETVLLVLAGRDSPDDPEGVEGAQYYNRAMQRFRCYQDGRWQNCIAQAISEYLLLANQTSAVLDQTPEMLTDSSEVWVDLSVAHEARLQLEAVSLQSSGAVCTIAYALEDDLDAWFTLVDDIGIEEPGIIRTSWDTIDDDAKTEVLVRINCQASADEGNTTMALRSVRLQIR